MRYLPALLLAIGLCSTPARGEEALKIVRPGDYQVIQRVGDKADVPLSLPAGAVGKVEARVLRGTEVVLPWTACGEARAGEAFAGKLANVPQGGWYALEVRLRRENAAGLTGRVEHFGVGIVVGVIGQSNASGYSGPPPYAAPHPLTSVYRACGIFEPLMDPACRPDPQAPLSEAQKADPELRKYIQPTEEFKRQTNAYLDWNCNYSCWPEFTAALAESCQVPVMIIPGARGAASSRQWTPGDGSNLYNNMLNQVRRSGSRMSAVIVNQGETDSQYGTAGAPGWLENTRKYVRAFRADLEQPELPFLFVSICTFNNGWVPSIRAATEQLCLEEPNCTHAAVTYDFSGIHYSKLQMGILAQRLAASYRSVVVGEKDLIAQGPRAGTIAWNSAKQRITVQFDLPLAAVAEVRGVEVLADTDQLPLVSLLNDVSEWPTAMGTAYSALQARRKASIGEDGRSLVIDCAGTFCAPPKAMIVRYAWLTNGGGRTNLTGADPLKLPVIPFSSEVPLP